ncbi:MULTISPECIES: hypothetical protein [Streptomyces]|uniref:Integral membrane protein n=1 Tax=Streptomyces lienomycini TaxID=284035 RepID=A0ABV9WRY3_9ACTN|nr:MULTISPECIES: hypothetical protein [Streptomyces]
MRRFLEFLGFLAVVQGVMALLQEFTDWDKGVVHRVDFLDGHELYAGVVLLALGFALFVAAAHRRPG